jgi:hypothetical protein
VKEEEYEAQQEGWNRISVHRYRLTSSSSSLLIGFLSPGTSPLEPMVHLSVRLQVSDYSTFLIMFDIPSTAVFFFVERVLKAFLLLFPDLF